MGRKGAGKGRIDFCNRRIGEAKFFHFLSNLILGHKHNLKNVNSTMHQVKVDVWMS